MLFAKLKEVNFIVRDTQKWVLTAKGKLAGGRIKSSEKLGDYIEWPENFDLSQLPAHQSPDLPVEFISSTKIANKFGIRSNTLNHLFSELGWLNKSLKGWIATEQGLKQGAVQSEDSRSGVPYVKWPDSITESKLLLSSINDISNVKITTTEPVLFTKATDSIEISENIAAKYKATDGHYVDSKAEMLIDNWLYMGEILHAYQRKLPVEENLFCDFYIPIGKVYIEYWASNNDPIYVARKEKKLAVYQKYGLQLIELNNKDVENLDDVLPRLLLKYGITAY